MSDQLTQFMLYANTVADAMNAAGVKPIGGDYTQAVMVLVAHGTEESGPSERPIGGAINWHKDQGKWEVDVELQYSQPVGAGDDRH